MFRNNILFEGMGLTELPVPSTSVVYTSHFDLFFIGHIEGEYQNPSYAFEYKATSDGNVALKIELEQGYYPPDVAFQQDDKWCIPDSALEFNDNLTDELYHIKAYPPSPTRFGRFKITGLTGNDASTVMSSLVLNIMQ